YTDERVLTALVWAHIKATEFINDPANHDKVVQYVMEFMGFDRDVAEAALPTVKFVEYPDVEEFRNYYYRLKEAGLLESTPEELGYGSEDAFFDDFLTDEYYRAVKEKLDANPNWVPEKVSPNEVVRIAYLPSDHHLALYVAQKEGYYEQVGLVSGENLEIKPPFANGVAIMEAFKNGEIDVGYLGGAPATLKRINDDVKIRIIAGANNEGSSIVVGAQSGINTPAQLAGKTIATPGFGTVQDFILRQLAEENGLRVVLK
ncbi:MAG: sulfonate transport system substrate-binding protein, partial [Methanosarcinales archaeon]|nr:sulfonate transport system substrate-binding protein [Methanosarcinales archaeon]